MKKNTQGSGFSRTGVIKMLETVAPALSDGRIIKILSHFWFTGKEVMAYNDNIAISVPFEQDAFAGALPGKLLLDFLNRISKDEIHFTPDESEPSLLLTATKSRMRCNLAIMPPSDFTFTWPGKPNRVSMTLAVDEGVRAAIKACMRSIGGDGHRPETRGITILTVDTGGVWMYATDSQTLTRVYASDAACTPCHTILPKAFCEQVLVLSKGSKKEGVLTITDRYAEFVTDSAKLYGRLLSSSDPVDFESIIERHFDDKMAKQAIKIPRNLAEVLSRAYIITQDTAVSDARAIFEVSNGGLTITSETERGSNRDLIAFPKHPDVRCNIDPERIHKAIEDGFDQILISRFCAVLTSPSELFMVSATGG